MGSFFSMDEKIKLNYTYLQSSCQIISVISGWKYGNLYFEKKICAKLSKNCKKEWEQSAPQISHMKLQCAYEYIS